MNRWTGGCDLFDGTSETREGERGVCKGASMYLYPDVLLQQTPPADCLLGEDADHIFIIH